ncbi:MAG TPA: hypothetical protein VIQ53_21565, partial [Inquilinus sp.]
LVPPRLAIEQGHPIDLDHAMPGPVNVQHGRLLRSAGSTREWRAPFFALSRCVKTGYRCDSG